MSKVESALHYLRYLQRRFVEDGCLQRASSLTYTTLFAVVPMMTVTYSMLSAIPSFDGVGEQVQNFIFEHFVPSAGATVEEYLQGFSRQARHLTAIGIAILVVTAFMMLRSIESALNAIWRVEHGRRGLAGFLLYWAILSLGPLLLGLGFVLTSYVASLKLFTDTSEMLGLGSWLFRILPFLMGVAAFCLIYMAVPNRKVLFRHALVGGITVSLLLELAKSLFALFISFSPSYQLIYGAFAAVPLFLLWIYLGWVIILIGAEMVRSLSDLQAIMIRHPLPNMIQALLVMEAFDEAFAHGQPMTREQYQLRRPISMEQWECCCRALAREGLLREDQEGSWTLCRNLAKVELWTLIRNLPWSIPTAKSLSEVNEALPSWLLSLLARLQRFDADGNKQFSISLSALFSGDEDSSPEPAAQSTP
ncbi:YihY family inner membrane protein [Aestuariirhabdus sp. Z084]|uniref:YihY family inner membrane protein n=1 Tax=Aestuariirhabdus haliotis TaxID=2918751 RepID=UPI00201B3B19|nr:YihY family inner membrane protein [Aestuariirhabdus haliotis]MCL6416304.1 YihY family inner membrane protein [Aestuariirhabdus haliotis]MCL6420177.1 YihY family inner membrane protein [Aestuariirhabdus haliotis]